VERSSSVDARSGDVAAVLAGHGVAVAAWRLGLRVRGHQSGSD
jgi:hypothetical protein